MELLMKLNCVLQGGEWMAWYLQTPLFTCLMWNQQRQRTVPDIVIEKMSQSLQDFPPLVAEGFAAVTKIDVTSADFDITKIHKQIQNLPRSIINRTNRTLNKNITLHRYSQLVDFDRLLHLISLIIRYPGIGNLRSLDPSLLLNIFGIVPQFASFLEEITAIIKKFYGAIHADIEAIASDLHWLEENGLIGCGSIATNPKPHQPLSSLPSQDSVLPLPLSTHAYSDLDTFTRLIQTIRFILHHPFLQDTGKGSLKTLVHALQENGIIDGDGLDIVRKDIEKVLKPYKILPEIQLRDGYFAGTAILSKHELIKVFDVLHSQAKSLDDPIALDIFETFKHRMTRCKDEKFSFVTNKNVYPVRAIANRSMIDPEFLPPDALSRNLQQLETAIFHGELVELSRFRGGGKFAGDEEGFFLAYPLQIVFCNVAWYLGFECVGGKYNGLFRFERLDRLFRGKQQNKWRSVAEQERSLNKLQRLYNASAGMFLGYSAAEQKLFLSRDKQEQQKASVTVELWFNDAIFRFITEGTKRFPAKQMKMSAPQARGRLLLPKSIFCLQRTGNEKFPNRFRVVLPKWSLNDVDLLKWIVGFGGSVKVIQPLELVEKVRKIGEEIGEANND